MLFAPRNNTVHPLPKAELPDNSIEKELNFCRLVSLAFGIPPIILLQVCHQKTEQAYSGCDYFIFTYLTSFNRAPTRVVLPLQQQGIHGQRASLQWSVVYWTHVLLLLVC